MILQGDVPSPIDPPSGCRFHPRCPKAQFPTCREVEPEFTSFGEDHIAACHFPLQGPDDLVAAAARSPSTDVGGDTPVEGAEDGTTPRADVSRGHGAGRLGRVRLRRGLTGRLRLGRHFSQLLHDFYSLLSTESVMFHRCRGHRTQ